MRWDLIIAVVIAVLGSSGLWAFLKFLITLKRKKKKKKELADEMKDMKDRMDQHEKDLKLVKAMSLGSLYDRAKFLGEAYIKRGHITLQEFADYKKYIYGPYHEGGGDGTIDKIMTEIEELPIEARKE